ncbi:3'-5' exonuclease family protein [Burkholderia pseudomallei]|uniref:3'-5' exoribonuclease n=1 Tax=Burkholderia pseudomallei TaxID=28450 RepID=UPI00068669F1|nr:3'-5' exoribonuclease [Burkholderia pseudomallei]
MLVFLDTEYTGLGQPTPKLISLGMVAEDGRREFYVELEDSWKPEDCSDFVQREVLPLLSGPAMSLLQARLSLRAWFAASPRVVRAACDSITDFRFLMEMLGESKPCNLASAPFDLRPLIDTSVYHDAVMAHYSTDDREHHALVDARAYRKGWLAWMDARKAKPLHAGDR